MRLVMALCTFLSSLAALTIAFPSNPADGQMQNGAIEKSVTSLTFSNGTVVGAPSSAALGMPIGFIYDSGTTTWYRTR